MITFGVQPSASKRLIQILPLPVLGAFLSGRHSGGWEKRIRILLA